jgi:hypothetical protein
MRGLSTIGSISLASAFVAGRKRVPSPATGRTAFFNGFGTGGYSPWGVVAARCAMPRQGWECRRARPKGPLPAQFGVNNFGLSLQHFPFGGVSATRPGQASGAWGSAGA